MVLVPERLARHSTLVSMLGDGEPPGASSEKPAGLLWGNELERVHHSTLIRAVNCQDYSYVKVARLVIYLTVTTQLLLAILVAYRSPVLANAGRYWLMPRAARCSLPLLLTKGRNSAGWT